MRFRHDPNHTVIQSIKNKQTGATSRFVVCAFDEEGVLETEDPKIIYILQNKVEGCTCEDATEVLAEKVVDILSDDDLRALAKDKGIRSWHNKKIENIKKELEEMEAL